MSSLLSLAPSGVFQRSLLPREPVRSYHTFSPLPWYGGIFSVALSLGLPPPGITWHCILSEPGLSSLTKVKAINHLSGWFKLILFSNNSILEYQLFTKFFDIKKHSKSIFPSTSSFRNLLWNALVKYLFELFSFIFPLGSTLVTHWY